MPRVVPSVKKRGKKQKTFSILEIIIVLSVSALLAGVTFIYVPKLIIKTQTLKAAEDLRTIGDAAMRYYADTGQWPQWPRTIWGGMLGDGFLNARRYQYGGAAMTDAPRWQGPYLDTWPYHPWTKLRTDTTAYQWDRRRDIVSSGDCHYIIEVSLNYITDAQRRTYITQLLDDIIDGGDGPCAGKFRGDRGSCPAWTRWPFYVVAQRVSGENIGNGCTP